MANKTKQGDWIDARGREIPPAYVKPLDKKRDQVVEVSINRLFRTEEHIRKAKKAVLMQLDKYEAAAEAAYGKRNKKGNLSLVNFSGNKRIDYKINDVIRFDDRLQRAKVIIDELLIEWAGESHRNLKTIITQAFDMDKRGKINTQAILKLRTLNIRNKKWNQAMDLISESITIEGSRAYLTASVRDENGKWQRINLNFSSI